MTAIYKEPVDEYISKNRKEIQIVIHFAKMTLVYVPPVQNYYYIIIPSSNGKNKHAQPPKDSAVCM